MCRSAFTPFITLLINQLATTTRTTAIISVQSYNGDALPTAVCLLLLSTTAAAAAAVAPADPPDSAEVELDAEEEDIKLFNAS